MATGLGLAKQFLDALGRIEEILERQLRHDESNRRNFIGAGGVPGGGAIGVQPQPVVLGNPKRRGFSFQNLGPTGSITLGLGLSTPVSGTGIVLAPGQSWDGRVSASLWMGSISMVGSQAGCLYSWLDV
jgi:hypothetical protein